MTTPGWDDFLARLRLRRQRKRCVACAVFGGGIALAAIVLICRDALGADGSSISAVAHEIEITTTGLLILFAIAVLVMAVVLTRHLKDCSSHRSEFHATDRRIEKKLVEVATNVEWLIRHTGRGGGKGDDDAET